jgi:hypothetical protein
LIFFCRVPVGPPYLAIIVLCYPIIPLSKKVVRCMMIVSLVAWLTRWLRQN